MSFQVGIGDVVLLAQLSARLVQVLSNGRKSAPAELRAVEHHLSLLTTALEAAKDLHQALRDDAEQQKLATCLASVVERCRTTLSHLESTITKYRSINEPRVLPLSTLGRLNESLSRNWKKVEWTTEKSNLQALRDELMQHTNTINLVIGLSTNVQTREVNISLSRVHTMTEDLHVWYEKNLARDRTKKPGTAQDFSEDGHPEPPVGGTTGKRTFELSITERGLVTTLCANSAIYDAWLTAFSARPDELPNQPLFTCWCRKRDGPLASDHGRAIEAYVATSSTFPVRQTGRGQIWRLLRVADRHSNAFVTLQVCKIHPDYVATLRSIFMDALALFQAKSILETGQGNSLAYVDSAHKARILASMSALHKSSTGVTAVKISANHRSITSESISDIQIARYQGIVSSESADSHLDCYFAPEPRADISISYQVQDALPHNKQIVRTILTMQRTTKAELDVKDAAVTISSVHAVSEYASGREINVADTTTTIHFAATEAAKEFQAALADMRFELFIHSLQYPRPGEEIVASIRASRIECHGDTSATYIDRGLINIFRSNTEVVDGSIQLRSSHRLVVADATGSMVLSQELSVQHPSTHLAALRSPPESTISNNAATLTPEVFVARIESDGIWRLHSPKRGFKTVVFTSEQDHRETLDIDSPMGALSQSPHDIEEVSLPHRIAL